MWPGLQFLVLLHLRVVQRMLEEQLIQQERLQSQNEWLAQQVSSTSLDQQSCGTGNDSGNHTAKHLPAQDERAAHIVVVC